MPRTRREWEEFAESIVDRVGEALDYWCWELSGGPVADCYSAHTGMDLYDLASEFVGWSVSGITEEDLELLQEMPEDIYDKYSTKLQESIEKVARKLEKERRKILREIGEKWEEW